MPAIRPPNPAARQSEVLFLGVDERDPRSLRPGLLHAGENLRFVDFLPQTRRGLLKPAWANHINGAKLLTWGTGYGVGRFSDPDETEWGLLAADGLVWRLRPYNYPVSVPLPAGVQVLTPCTFVQAFDKVYCFRGRHLAPLRLLNFDDGFQDLLTHWNATVTHAAGVEVSYGPFQAVTSITRVNDVATVTTPAPHGYITGADITLRGAVETAYNGRFTITVTSDVTFTYAVASAPTTPATGTILASNMSTYYRALGTLLSLAAGELTSAATTATVHHTGHGFTSGQTVTIAGATQTEYNGSYVITVTDADHFTYTFAGSGTTPATGTITVRNTLVIVGQSPDSAATSWQRLYNILPNADNALYVNNRLLVPTAYEPASVDNYATFNGGAYRKKDYLIATDYLDDLHFDFADEFRINQGSADEIVDLAKFNEDTVIIWKGTGWAVLSNVALDLTNLKLDFRQQAYGLAARGAWAQAGENLYFMAPKRGVVSIRQSEQNKLLSVDVPLSAPIRKTMARVNWNAIAGCRMANWDSKLYTALPIDNGATNNALLIYDFVSAARGQSDTLDNTGWCPIDTGQAVVPQDFFQLFVDGEERLIFLGTDGFVSLVEGTDFGDEYGDATTTSGLAVQEIATRQVSRALQPSTDRHRLPTEIAIVLQAWNPTYSVTVHFDGVNKKTIVATDKTRSRTRYYRPWNALPWDESNVDDDHSTPYRQDYSVTVPAGGVSLGSGLAVDLFQETLEAFNLVGRRGRSFQVEITNTQGRLKCLGNDLETVPGRQRKGILV